ncbi:MAG TPA: hypothetical protein VGK74_26670 [Symbiobacteriaceae bacterium]|jgi:hypothetical protein
MSATEASQTATDESALWENRGLSVYRYVLYVTGDRAGAERLACEAIYRTASAVRGGRRGE